MKFIDDNGQSIYALLSLAILAVASFSAWWLGEHVLSLDLPLPVYSFTGFVLLIGAWILWDYLRYLFRGYYIYDDRCEILIYKDRKHGSLELPIVFRYKDGKYDGSDIHVPPDKIWKREMPDWAKENKRVIVQRLKKSSPVNNHQIVESEQ